MFVREKERWKRKDVCEKERGREGGRGGGHPGALVYIRADTVAGKPEYDLNFL